MCEVIPDSLLARIGEIIESRLGLGFPEGRRKEFVRAVRASMEDLGYPDVRTFFESVAAGSLGQKELDLLASCVTIGETYFFRHMEQFEVFRDHVLPALIKTRWTNGRRLKIWSAGCAGGEEPFSIAIMTGGLVPDLTGWDVTVVGSDVNRQSLRNASEGRFGEWSFRSVPEYIKSRFFKRTGDKLEIVPEIRKLVRFSHINLIEQQHPVASVGIDSADVIFCRNVLMYFKPQVQQKVVDGLANGLSDDGWLIVSPAEAAVVQHPELKAEIFPGVILYRKHRASLSRALMTSTPSFEALLPVPTTPPPVPAPLITPIVLCDTQLPAVKLSAESPRPQRQTEMTWEKCCELFDRGSYTEAIQGLEGYLHGKDMKAKGNADALSLLAKAYANLGRLDEAAVWSEKAVQADNLNPRRHFFHGTVLMERDLTDEAAKAMRRAIFLDSDFVAAHLALGSIAARTGDREASEKHHSMVLRILSGRATDELVPATEGMTVGKLTGFVQTIMGKENSYNAA